MASKFIALLSDFGYKDPFLGSVKASILTQTPDATIIDLCHDLPAHDILTAAFALFRSYKDFPTYSVFLAVVDPGVGGQRRPILVATEDYFFVGPDNGIFSFIYSTEDVRQVYHITSSHYFRQPVSQTFHARDVFAPVAAWLATGIEPHKFGDPIEDYVKLHVPVEKIGGESITGAAIGTDRFGNVLTNIRLSTIQDFAARSKVNRFAISILGREVPLVGGGYAQKLPLFALLNSANLIEIASSSSPASEILGIKTFPLEISILPLK
jgi:S-adenosyl-L-methionine hydrolase (adenosine-forming)